MFKLPDLPVSSFIPQIAENLLASSSHFLVLTAETGAGKSTVVPLGLSDYFQGKILTTEPRRIAAVSIAERISNTINENCGQTCGYKIHLENCISKNTRIEIVTEAILSRTLQTDPSMEGYSVIILDEFHERSVSTDLNLAFLKEALLLRDDLYVIVMSATMDAASVSTYLDNCPVMEIPGRTFPVEVEYKPETSMTNVIIDEIQNPFNSGRSVLVFLPGIREIRHENEELHTKLNEYNLSDDAEILLLHSSISLSEQKKIFTPVPQGISRIILSSAIAETSLTVPDVVTVIDSGLSRINRMNISTGMETLVTESESEFSSEQRKGRAGRTQKGRCIRLWSQNDPRQKTMLPEILRTDITSLVLECGAWGQSNLDKIDFLDSPSKASWETSKTLLQKMNLISTSGTITEKGKAALKLGLHPRLACVLLESKKGDYQVQETAVSLVLKYSNYAESSPQIQKRFTEDLLQKLDKIPEFSSNFHDLYNNSKDYIKALLLFAGFFDRLAKKEEVQDFEKKQINYRFPSGRVATLRNDISFSQAPLWLIAPEVTATQTGGNIFDYDAVPESLALKLIEPFITANIEFQFDDNQKIRKTEKNCYGKIILAEKKLTADKEDYALAYCTQIRQKGLNSLNLSHKTIDFLTRAQFYFENIKSENDFVVANEKSSILTSLAKNPETWLVPFITDGKITDEIIYNSLYWHLNGSDIDRQVPVQLILPNGRKVKISYELQSDPKDKTKLILRPVIEIIIQRIFGCFETPKIMGVPVLLKLLSPASRPLQITDDLENFWTSSWPEICKEMKGRYPKHNWDYRISEKD